MNTFPTTKQIETDTTTTIAATAGFLNSQAGVATVVLAVIAVIVSFLISRGWAGFFGAGLAIIALAIAVIDYRSFRIPDWLNASGFVLALIYASAQDPEAWLMAIAAACLRGVALALIFLALRYSYKRVRGREGLGLGDVKLAWMAGAWLEWAYIPIAIQVAAFAALGAFLLRYVIFKQPLAPTARLPFGTFLAPAIWMSWALEQTLIVIQMP